MHAVVSVIVIPILVVAIVGLVGYLVYRYLIADMSSRRNVSMTLRRYDIDKTPSQIVREYYLLKGQTLSDREVRNIEREYVRNEPDQFLSMYDVIREQGGPRGRRTRDDRGDDKSDRGSGGNMGADQA